MIIYQLRQNPERFCSFTPSVAADRTIYHRFDGTAVGRDWKEHVIRAADEPDQNAQLPDFALLGVIPVFSEHAVSVLRDFLGANGELLPLRHERRRYFALNVTTVIDALDEQRSHVDRFSDGGIMSIDAYVFKQEAIRDATIFKIPQLPRAHVYVTDVVVDRVRRAELLGFVFRQLWSDAVPG